MPAPFTFVDSQPASTSYPSQSQPVMQTNNVSTKDILAVDHVTFNNESGGQHLQVTFNSNNVPSPNGSGNYSPPTLFTNTVGSLPQPFFYSGNSSQSSSQYSNATNGSTFAFGGIILKWGSITLSNSTSTTVTYVSAFINATLSVVIYPSNVNAAALTRSSNIYISSKTTTSFVITHPLPSASSTFYYQVIGY